MMGDRVLRRRQVVLTGTEHVIKRRIDEFCQEHGLELLDFAFEASKARDEIEKFRSISEAVAQKWGRQSVERAQCDMLMAKYILKPAIQFTKGASKSSRG